MPQNKNQEPKNQDPKKEYKNSRFKERIHKIQITNASDNRGAFVIFFLEFICFLTSLIFFFGSWPLGFLVLNAFYIFLSSFLLSATEPVGSLLTIISC